MPHQEETPKSERDLRRILNDLRDDYCDGHTVRLEAAIAEANRRSRDDPPPIDRKKLTEFLDEPSRRTRVKFSLMELEAIAKYLALHRFRLGDLFEQRSLLASLAERQKVTCLLGAQEHTQRDRKRLAVGAWDVRGLHVFLVSLGRLAMPVQVDLQEVLWSNKKRVTENNFRNEGWHGCLVDDGPSIVCIGSPKVNHATELILARMLGKKPFRTPTGEPDPDGVYFIWPPNEHALPSAFGLPPSAIRKTDPKLADQVERGMASALYFKGTLYPAQSFGESNPTYGVIAAQRRKGGATWLCVAGLSGPSTFAAAMRVEEVSSPIPGALPGAPSVPLVIGVWEQSGHSTHSIDPREVREHGLLDTQGEEMRAVVPPAALPGALPPGRR